MRVVQRHLIFCLAVFSWSVSTINVATAEEVEVMHWWTSGGEAAAVAKFKEALKARGHQWKDVAVGGSDNAKLLLKTRFTKGNPPAAAQINDDVKPYAADASKLADLSAIAQKGHWDEVLPPIIQRYAKMETPNYVVTPVNVHRRNMMWISAPVMKKIDGVPPKTWDEFFALAEKARKAGVIPVAAAENWTLALLFEQVAFSTMGAELYKKAFYDLDDKALRGPEMVKTFEVFRRIKGYTDKSSTTRKWNEATQMVIQGKALLQIMGDWAKGEFSVANLKPNQDFYCAPVPGANGHIFNSDTFIFFKVKGQQSAGQTALAEVLMSKEAQEAFNLIKGSVPVRLDADMSKFDECGKQSHSDFINASKQGTLLASPDQFQPTGRTNAWRDVAVSFWSDDRITAQQAAEKMAAGAKVN